MGAPRSRRIRRTAVGLTLALGTIVAPTGCGDESNATGDCSASLSPAVDWSGCDKRGIDLSGKIFQNARFANTDFSGANFQEASLTNVDMRGADLTDANLQNAVISNGTPHLAKYCRTVMPDGTIQSSGCD